MENTKMSSKLLSWVWFGIAIIALILFMYYQSQRNADTSGLADTASSTDEMVADDTTGVNLTGSVESSITSSNNDTTVVTATEPVATTPAASASKQERNTGYISSIYTADTKAWAGVDFASVYLAERKVVNANNDILTFAIAPSVKITLDGQMMSLADFMARFNSSEALQSTIFRFTLAKDSMIYGIEEVKI